MSAAPDYEPTADEIQAFLAKFFPPEDTTPGSHGGMTIIPAYERYIWSFPVHWGNRTVNGDGTVSFTWCVPQVCPADE